MNDRELAAHLCEAHGVRQGPYAEPMGLAVQEAFHRAAHRKPHFAEGQEHDHLSEAAPAGLRVVKP